MPMIYVPPKRRTYGGRGAYKRTYGGKGAYHRKGRGRGAYTVDDGPWANRGAAVGEYLAKSMGGPGALGSWLGRRLFHYPASWLGSGAYRRRKGRGKGSYTVEDTPAGRLAPDIPHFEKGDGDDSVTVSFREYIGDVYTSGTAGAFNVTEYIINPGNQTTFPWLSSVSQCSFQQYKFISAMFQFKSTSSDALNSTNTALGAVIGCINYDANDPPFTSRMQMENTSWAQCCKPSQNMLLPVECDPRMTAMQGMLYVSNNGVLPAEADPKTYYLGKLSLATTGFQGTNINIGSLYVTYKVKLYKPIMLPPLSNANRTLYIRSGVTSAIPFGTTAVSIPHAQCDTLGVTFTNTTLTVPKRRLQNGQMFIVIISWQHANGATTVPNGAWNTASGVLQWNMFGSAAQFSGTSWPAAGATATDSGQIWAISCENDNNDMVLTYSGATFPASATVNVQVWQVCGMPSTRLGTLA